MFIDYVTLLLVNMAAGLLILSVFLFRRSEDNSLKAWCVPLGMAGVVAFLGGLHTTFTWPLPGSFNIVFGEMSILFGVILGGIAVAVWREWSLVPVATYSLLPGAVAIMLGIRIIQLGMTKSPIIAGIGFMLSGLGGVLLLPAVLMKKSAVVRSVVSLVLILGAAVWILVGFGAYWGHAESFSQWQPPTMQQEN